MSFTDMAIDKVVYKKLVATMNTALVSRTENIITPSVGDILLDVTLKIGGSTRVQLNVFGNVSADMTVQIYKNGEDLGALGCSYSSSPAYITVDINPFDRLTVRKVSGSDVGSYTIGYQSVIEDNQSQYYIRHV